MTSYLDGRTQRIIIGQASSSSKPLNTGVPQDSVLGPILFSFYEQPIGEIIRKHGLAFHHYADDLQILITFYLNIDSLLDAIRRLEECIAEIKTWMTANYLKVNDDKSEFMPVVPRSAAHLLEGLTISIGEVRVSAVKNVRNLGAYLDSHLDMSHNVAILLKSKYEHVTPVLRELHWLPVESRIHFKIMVLVHRAVNDTGPVYLQELVNMYRPGRSLRSQSDRLLTRPRTRSRAGDASFVSAAADLWNNSPLNLRLIEDICNFRTALKAHYFTKHYGD